jgi:hypothetical protein
MVQAYWRVIGLPWCWNTGGAWSYCPRVYGSEILFKSDYSALSYWDLALFIAFAVAT